MDIKHKTPAAIFPAPAAFSSALSLGTVLHGTVVHHGGFRVFFIDNLLHYKGRKVDAPFGEKLKLVQGMLETEIDSALYLPRQLTFYLCPLAYAPTAFQLPFPLFCIKSVHLQTSKIVNYQDVCKALPVRKTDAGDVYEIVDGTETTLAGVNTYACSAALKVLFGQPDQSLDCIEDSDDEGGNAFTVEERTMHCRWHPTHKQWVPIVDWV